MIKIIKQEISFDDSLKKKLEFICDLYTHNALDQETFDGIKNNYSKDKKKMILSDNALNHLL